MEMPEQLMKEYQYAQANAAHPELRAYEEILHARASHSLDNVQTQGTLGEDKILASGLSPNGGVEMLVRKADGVVVLLMPDLPQVRNTPRGPKMVKTQMPLELPLVRSTAPRHLTMRLNRVWGYPPMFACLLFQGRFNTAAREITLW